MLLALCASMHTAQAEVHAYSFSGNIDNLRSTSWGAGPLPVAPISIGDSVTGTFSFDDAQFKDYLHADPLIPSEQYDGNGPQYSLEFTIKPHGGHFTSGATSFFTIGRDVPGADLMNIGGVNANKLMYLVFRNNSLPDPYPRRAFNIDPGSYDFAILSISWANSSGIYGAEGHVSNFVAVSPVPEPSTYFMLLAGLAVTGVAARRRRSPGQLR